VPLVEFVHDQRRDARELRILEHLSQENSFGHVPDPGRRARQVFEPDLVAHFAAERHAQLGRRAHRQEPGGDPPGLQDRHLPPLQESVPEEHLRDLGRFAGSRGGGQNEPAFLP